MRHFGHWQQATTRGEASWPQAFRRVSFKECPSYQGGGRFCTKCFCKALEMPSAPQSTQKPGGGAVSESLEKALPQKRQKSPSKTPCPNSNNSFQGGGGLGASMPRSSRRVSGYSRNSARNSKFHSWTDSITALRWQHLYLRLAAKSAKSVRGPQGPQKNHLGRQKRECESPESNPKRAPPPNKRLLAQCAWVPVTQNQTQETRQKRRKEGTNPPTRGGTSSAPGRP